MSDKSLSLKPEGTVRYNLLLMLTSFAILLTSCLKPSSSFSPSPCPNPEREGSWTWINRSAVGDKAWFSIASSSDGKRLAAVVSNGDIYTSDDSGTTWTYRSEEAEADEPVNPIFGNKNWFSIASSSDGSKLAAVAFDEEGKSNGSIYTGDLQQDF